MEYKEFSAKTVSDAITEACKYYSVPSDRLDYEVVEEGSSGFFGIGAKPAVIKAREKVAEVKIEKPVEKPVEKKAEKKVDRFEKKTEKPTEKTVVKAAEKTVEKAAGKEAPVKKEINRDEIEKAAKDFLNNVFEAMEMEVIINIKYDEKERTMDIDLVGAEMGVLIGKRGQTLDSLQYLVSLVVNKESDEHIRVKVDTEDYRQRRKETLENLAKNIAYKVKRGKRPVFLEPMNPYERRIIHSALQNDKYVTTHSEGEEPNRRVVVTLKR